MATSLVLVVLFGFVVLCCLVRVQKGREPDFSFLEGLKEVLSAFECLKVFCKELFV